MPKVITNVNANAKTNFLKFAFVILFIFFPHPFLLIILLNYTDKINIPLLNLKTMSDHMQKLYVNFLF